jgi:hypothetical protein
MILILGTSSYEQGTNPVIDWLIHYKAAFIKITIEDLFTNFEDIKVMLTISGLPIVIPF